MKRFIFVLSAILLSSLFLNAQSSSGRSSSLRLNWGMGKVKRQDFIFSPVLHEQWSPFNLALTYSHSNRLVHQVYAKFSRYTPSVVEPYSFYWDTPDELSPTGTHEFNMLDLNYSIGKQVISGTPLEVVIGGRSRNRLHQSYYCYGPDWLWHFGYYFSFGMDAWTRISYVLNASNHLELNLALPLFSYNARSPYMAQNDAYFENIYSHKALPTLASHIADGELQSWGRSRSLDFDLTYDHALSERWDLGISYWFSLHMNNTPVDLKSVEQVLYLTAKFNF